MSGAIDPDSNEARLARHRDACRMVHPDVSAAKRREVELERTALGNCQEQLQVAIGHLQDVLNKARTHAEQQAADTAARDWLISIGSEPT